MSQEALTNAKAIARDKGCFIVYSSGNYLMYRIVHPKNQFIGKSGTIEGICRLVKKVCQ